MVSVSVNSLPTSLDRTVDSKLTETVFMPAAKATEEAGVTQL